MEIDVNLKKKWLRHFYNNTMYNLTIYSNYNSLYQACNLNVIPYNQYQSDNYDVAPLVDWKNLNAGFLYIRATPASVKIYQASAHIANTEPKTDDQLALNRAIK